MEPQGMNIKLAPRKTLAFTTPYNATTGKVAATVRQMVWFIGV